MRMLANCVKDSENFVLGNVYKVQYAIGAYVSLINKNGYPEVIHKNHFLFSVEFKKFQSYSDCLEFLNKKKDKLLKEIMNEEEFKS